MINATNQIDPRLQPLIDKASSHSIQVPLNLIAIRSGTHTFDQYNTLPMASLPLIKTFDFHYGQADCKITMYHPSPEEALPLIVFFPGTGFVLDCFEVQATFASQLASIARCVVLSVTYRLAPEFPYPAAVNDCESVIHFRHSFFEDQGIKVNAHNYALLGVSSGGLLAAMVIQRLINRSNQSNTLQLPQGLHLHGPIINFDCTKNSFKQYGKGFLLDTKVAQLWYGAFMNQAPQPFIKTPESFEDYQLKEKFPPTLITYAQCDPLSGDALLYQSYLKQAGVSVGCKVFTHQPHAFMAYNQLVPDKVDELLHLSADFYKTVL